MRERHGGLLSLLEKHPAIFHVQRIPKSDQVSLRVAHIMRAPAPASSSAALSGGATAPWSSSHSDQSSDGVGESLPRGPDGKPCPLLPLLTSELWVPTQAWPTDLPKDWPYVQVRGAAVPFCASLCPPRSSVLAF